MKATLALLCLALAQLGRAVTVQDLGSLAWTAINANKSISVQSRVPGSIYSDLEGNKKIEPIYRDYNDLYTRWVSYDSWTFERQFDVVNNDFFEKNHVNLVAHGLDTIGEVHLNGHLLGKVDNMFVRYQWPVKSLLKRTGNTIQIRFQSAPKVAKHMFDKYSKEKYPLPPVKVRSSQRGESHVNMLRKMQASFSWDWGPAFPTQGIWRPIELEAFQTLVPRSVSVDTQPLPSNGGWHLKFSAFVEGTPSAHSEGKVDVYLNDTHTGELNYKIQFDANGQGNISGAVNIVDPHIKAWYPNGVGEQHLYKFHLKITPKGEKEIHTRHIKIGFRTVKLVQEKLPSKTEAYSFYFKVNDVPIWSKGSNWIPAHVLHEAVTEGYLRELLHSAKLANMNMLRVWGGGIYEDDAFYEIADEYGILIWQDMMFACAAYRTDDEFLDSVKVEIRQQIRRLQHHPSIAIWAGNNEVEGGLARAWWPEVRKGHPHYEDYRKDYRKLYIEVIKPIVEQEDTTRSYVSSSPSNGIKAASEHYTSSNPSSKHYGDIHFYTMGDVWNWTIYPSAKFVSEYGFQAWSSLHTMEPALEIAEIKLPLDKDWQHREHGGNWLTHLNKMIDLYIPHASDGNVSAIEEYIYTTQIIQAMALKTETEFYRRNRAVKENGEGHTMGALYWQLNDIWPTVSWASTEFGGKWKMSHYYVKHMFDNLLVNAWEEHGELRVVVIRDDHHGKQKYQLNIEVFDWANLKPVYQKEIPVETTPFNVTLAFHQKVDDFIKAAHCKSRQHCFVQVSLTQDGHVKAKNFHFLDWPKNAIGLEKPRLEVKSVKGPYKTPHGRFSFDVELETDRVAPFVWLDFAHNNTNFEGLWSDNGFMMTNQTVHVSLESLSTHTIDQIKNAITILSLKDVK